MRLFALASICGCIVLTGCATRPVLRIPAKLTAVPGKDATLGEWLESARDQLQQQDTSGAIETVEKILAKHPENVNTHRLRQDILRQRGRIGLVMHEAEKRLKEHPDRAAAHYLKGRIEDTDAAKRAAFERCIELDPANFWGWYGLAFTLRDEDNGAANSIYRYLYSQSKHDLRTGIAYAASLRRGGHHADAFRVYNELRRDNPGIGALGMTETLVRSGKNKQAWRHLLAAMRDRPFDAGVRGVVGTMLARGLPQDGMEELLDTLRADPAQMAAFAKSGPSLLAALFDYAGDEASALAVLRTSGSMPASDRRRYRRLLINVDGVAAFLADVDHGMFREFLDDEGNQVRAVWMGLLTGPWMRGSDPLGTREQSTALVRALMGVGYLRYADLVCSKALLRHAEAPELGRLRAEVRKEIAFEAGLRRILTRGYVRFAQEGTDPSLDQVLQRIRKLSTRILGKDVVGTPKRFSLPFVGTLIDSMGPGLPSHLAKYNKHLVMGKRSSRPVEGMVLTRLSQRLIEPDPDVPMPPRTIEVVGENRELEPLDQVDLAGIALLNHYVIDMDEVRAWARGIAERRRIAREDDGVVLRDPLPEDVPAAAPAGVEWRLSLLSPVEDSKLDAAVLDIIRWHERGHMVDFLHFLPVTVHPLRAAALALRNGFSALGIAAEMEGRAELTALAMSPHTRLVLAHVGGFLVGDGGESPHAHGFRTLCDEMLAELRRQDVPNADVRHWHRVDPHILRGAAKKLLKRLW